MVNVSVNDHFHWSGGLLAWWLNVVAGCIGDGVAPPCVVHCPDGGGIEWTPLEDFARQNAAGLPVLVTQ